MIDVALKHPDTIRLGLGMPATGEAGEAAAAQPYFLDFYDRPTVQEKIDSLLAFQEVIDALTTAENAALLAEVADDGTKTWACMTDEEIQRSQQIGFATLSG